LLLDREEQLGDRFEQREAKMELFRLHRRISSTSVVGTPTIGQVSLGSFEAWATQAA